jgi:hypothetical protein
MQEIIKPYSEMDLPLFVRPLSSKAVQGSCIIKTLLSA